MELKNRVIVITGAGQGLGRQFALDCVAKGARVALGDYNHESAESVAGECTAAGGEASSYAVDVTKEEQVVDFYSRVVEDFGTLDATINNAGILRDNLLVKERDGEVTGFPLKKWQAVIDTNLTGVFLCGREAAVNLVRLKKSGVIINISSIAYHGNFGQSNYSAAKAGVASMTVLWAKELAQYEIRVGAVAPGFTATEMVMSLRDDVKEKFTTSVPLRRFADPSEISAGVLFLLKNDYVTGEILEISGGVRI